jgi:hypothetical protein
MASSLELAFNNPDESDVTVVITTENAEEYRARTQRETRRPGSMPAAPLAESPGGGDTRSPPVKDSPVFEELHGHKVVLKWHSEFFKAAVDWNNIGTSSELDTSRGSRKRSREGPEVAVMFLSDEQQLGTAKLMIRFMYSQTLADGIGRSEVMRLMLLADQFSVPNLRHACMVHLAAIPLKQWSVEERQLLCSCWTPVSNDSRLGVAANDLHTAFAEHFTELETALADESNWKLMCSLPRSVVVQILSSENLVVRSENTVLVAALSWLREAGKDCPAAERKEVMAQVRLLHLSPWFLSWFICRVPEAQALLPPGSLEALVQYSAHALPSDKAQLAERSTFVKRCAVARAGMNPGLQAHMAFGLPGDTLVGAVVICLAHQASVGTGSRGEGANDSNKGNSMCSSGNQFFNGVWWGAVLAVEWWEGKVEVLVTLDADLKVGTEFVGKDTSAFKYACNYTFTVSSSPGAHLHAVKGMQMIVLGGGGCGTAPFRISPTDGDPLPIVQGWLEGGQLLVKYTLLS